MSLRRRLPNIDDSTGAPLSASRCAAGGRQSSSRLWTATLGAVLHALPTCRRRAPPRPLARCEVRRGDCARVTSARHLTAPAPSIPKTPAERCKTRHTRAHRRSRRVPLLSQAVAADSSGGAFRFESTLASGCVDDDDGQRLTDPPSPDLADTGSLLQCVERSSPLSPPHTQTPTLFRPHVRPTTTRSAR